MSNRWKWKWFSLSIQGRLETLQLLSAVQQCGWINLCEFPWQHLGEEEMQTTWGRDAHVLACKTAPHSIPVSWNHTLEQELEERHQLWCLWTWSLHAMSRCPGRSVDLFAPSLVPLDQLQLLCWATQFCLCLYGPRRREVQMMWCQSRSCRFCKVRVGPNECC